MYYTVQLIQQTFYKNLTGRGHEKSRISAASEAFNAWLYSVTTVENPLTGIDAFPRQNCSFSAKTLKLPSYVFGPG